MVGALSARLGLPGVALTLEGGYDLDALRASVAATVRGVLAGRGEGREDRLISGYTRGPLEHRGE